MSLKTKIVLCSLAASGLALGSTALYAADPSVTINHFAVDSAGLNLDTTNGVAKLYRRIHFAAEQTCTPRNITGFYYTWSGYTSCVSSAVSQGVAAFHNAALSAYLQQQSPEIRVAQQ